MRDYLSPIFKLAQKAFSEDEVPIGAIIVDRAGTIIGQGHNQTHARKDGLAHAELLAIKQAQKKLADWRLESCTVYVTVEPCLMCLGAIANTRISKVCYILADPLFGSVESKLTKKQLAKLFPRLMIEKLPDDGRAKELMSSFFKTLRAK